VFYAALLMLSRKAIKTRKLAGKKRAHLQTKLAGIAFGARFLAKV
jgi:hypothetical protein